MNLSFVAAFAPLKVSLWRRMSADATGIFILTWDNALLLTAFALAFSPVCPLSENDGKTTGNRLRLTRFLPVNLSFVAAFAALKVSFPGACPGKDDFYFDEETTSSLRIRLLECFLFVLLFRSQGTFSRGENELYKFFE